MTQWDARSSKEMDLGRQQASWQFWGSDVDAPSAAEHLLTFSLPVQFPRGEAALLCSEG